MMVNSLVLIVQQIVAFGLLSVLLVSSTDAYRSMVNKAYEPRPIASNPYASVPELYEDGNIYEENINYSPPQSSRASPYNPRPQAPTYATAAADPQPYQAPPYQAQPYQAPPSAYPQETYYSAQRGSVLLRGHCGVNGLTTLNGPIELSGVEGLIGLNGVILPGSLSLNGQIKLNSGTRNITLLGAISSNAALLVNGMITDSVSYGSYTPNSVELLALNGSIVENGVSRLNGTIGLNYQTTSISVRVLVGNDGQIRVDARIGPNSEDDLENMIQAEQAELRQRVIDQILVSLGDQHLANLAEAGIDEGYAPGYKAARAARGAAAGKARAAAGAAAGAARGARS